MMQAALATLRRLLCRLVGHNDPITFRPEGVFWCRSAGGYDCVCLRCGWRWESTPEGSAALARSQSDDPRRRS
jgi:hypothetical protein